MGPQLVDGKKTLVISAFCLPPVLIGPAILMGNLFRHFPKGSYHVLTGRLDHVWPPIDKDSMLPAPYTFTRYPFSLMLSGSSLRQRIRSLLRDVFALFEVAWKGLRIIRQENIDNIFVVADHYVELAALIMHWLTGKKIVIWFPDLYYHYDVKNQSQLEKLLPRFLEPRILKWANNVLVASNATKEYYKTKYGKETDELKHSTELKAYNRTLGKKAQKGEFTIMYTGVVTWGHYDSILDLVEVVENFDSINIKFVLLTTSNHHELKKRGIEGEKVIYKLADRAEIPEIQQSADILFLPLAFHYYSDLNVKTASPSKLPEYLASGRPMLVYAPSNSYYVKYAREHDFALIVDKKDPVLLRKAILELRSNESLCQRLTANARRTAVKYHDSRKVSLQLQNILFK